MSHYNLQSFLSTVTRNNLQRSAYYRCRIPIDLIGGFSNARVGLFPNAVKLLKNGLICESTMTPTRGFEVTPMTIYGYEEKYPTFTTYTDFDCTFISPLFPEPTTGIMRNEIADVFHAWQALIQPQTRVQGTERTITDSTMNLSFPDSYRLKNGFKLELFDSYDQLESESDDAKATLTYEYFNVYPVNFHSIPLAWNDNDGLFKTTVTFAYSYWATTKTTIY